MPTRIFSPAVIVVAAAAVGCAAGGSDTGALGTGGRGSEGTGAHSGTSTNTNSGTMSTSSFTTTTQVTTGTQTTSSTGAEMGGNTSVGGGGVGGAGVTSASVGAGGSLCTPGTKSCNGTVLTSCDDNNVESMVDCATTNEICVTGKGCLVCDPNANTCVNGNAVDCLADGSATVTYTCDTLQGETCDPDGCHGACTPLNLGTSYIGCEYWPTVTLNPVWNKFDYAVAVANTTSTDATVNVTRNGGTVASTTVAGNSVQVIKLPWVTALKGGDVSSTGVPPDPGSTVMVAGGAYRLRSNQPVTVYQLSALEYSIPIGGNGTCPAYDNSGTCYSYSNDASLLLPTNVLTGNYTALSWPSLDVNSGLIAVTATQDNTQVTVNGVGQFAAGAGISASGTGTVTLNTGDVLQMIAKHGACNVFTGCTGYGGDMSGTIITANAPVQVIGGHQCANVPNISTGYCDHLEEVMFPQETLGMDYLISFPEAPGPSQSPHTLRIAATNSATHVTFDPAIHAPATLNPGSAPLQIAGVTQDVHITSDQPILVSQYMQGSVSVPSMLGDPAESLGIATAQYRSSYLFIASSTYTANYVNVTAPMGATITLDGAVIAAGQFNAIGSSGYGTARVKLAQTPETHNISGDMAFGIVVYGYGSYTSYMYPGGLNLNAINIMPGGG